ncbi:MAG TPA: hypothetical protein VGF79_11945 [Bacteroidia bacterium]
MKRNTVVTLHPFVVVVLVLAHFVHLCFQFFLLTSVSVFNNSFDEVDNMSSSSDGSCLPAQDVFV